ncbi:hypothetical protein NL487_27815, partial [Klebsiella pneumoniae]|nr:hypothetical protein [Klebsiella pneumoniae]
ETSRLDWDDRVGRDLLESLTEVAKEATEPTGWRKVVRGGVTFLGNVVPEGVFVAGMVVLMWRFFVESMTPDLSQVVWLLLATVGV